MSRSLEPFRRALYAAWVIPYSILVLSFLICYLKLFFHLAGRFKLLFFASGFLYVFGALGIEIIGVTRAYEHGLNDQTYKLIATIEESLELTGIALFNYTLLCFISINFKNRTQTFFSIKYRVTD